MKNVHLLCVGKLRDKNLLALESDFFKRIKDFKLHLHELKSFDENLNQESEEVLHRIQKIEKSSQAKIMTLEERGQSFTSPQFSDWFYQNLTHHSQLVFIIGGASGHGKKVLDLSKESLSLSPLTYPHQIARVLFVEQLYRAQTISQGHPYHK